MAINWDMGVAPDVGANALAAFEQGRQTRRADNSRNALATLAQNPNDPKAFGLLAQSAPETAIQFKQNQTQQQLAHAKQRVEMIGQAAMWADTPEKWDAAVSYLEQQGMPEVAQYRGKFTPELRMSAISSAGQLKAQLEAEKPLVGRPGDWVMDPRDPSKVLQKVPFAPHYGVVGEGQTAFRDQPGVVDPQGIFQRMIGAESGGNQFAPNGQPLTSPAGAIGIAQVMPTTAPEAAKLAGLPYDEARYRTDPQYNATIGKAYFQKQLADFGDPMLAVAAYNAGAGRVRAALQKGGPDRWMDYVPAETKAYVAKVMGNGTQVIAQGAPKAGGGTPTGLLEKGYRVKPDGTMEPIPGGPADPGSIDMPAPKEMAKRNAAYPKVAGAWRTASSKIDQQITDVKKLLDMPGLASIVGAVDGRTPTFLPEASAAKALYDQVMARAQFNELQEMRNSSPTGGALGAVSDSENKTLRDAAAALDRKQAEADFEARAKDYLSTLERAKGNLQQTFEETYSYRNAQKASNQPAGDVDAILRKHGVLK